MKVSLPRRFLGVVVGVVLGLLVAAVASPYVARMLGHRAQPKTYLMGGGF